MPLKEHQQARTISGRITTKFPKVDISTERRAINSVKRLNKWLIDNAIKEAEARVDDFNLLIFKSMSPKLSDGDVSSINLYLFGR